MKMKCFKCEKQLSKTSFYKNKSRKRGYAQACIRCMTGYKKNLKRTYLKKYGVKYDYAGALKTKYSLTVNQYQKLNKKQHNKCAICKNPESSRRALSVDHNHKTKKNRGLLCQKCNTLIGMAAENLSILKAAIKYIKKHEYQ